MSALLGAVAAEPPTGSPIMARFEPLNLHESHVRPDFDVDAEDMYPLFDTSLVSDGDLSLISPATTRESISTDSEGEAESFHSTGVNVHHSSHCGAAAPVAAAGSSSIVDPGRN